MPDDRARLAAHLRQQHERRRSMRWVICALVMLALPPGAFAADLSGDFGALRGAQPVGPARFVKWDGFYFGGQIGMADTSADFHNATSTPIAFALRQTFLEQDIAPSNWQVLGSADHTNLAYGGFFGYNTQWQDAVLGVELNYDRSSFVLVPPNSSIARSVGPDSANNTYIVNISATGRLRDLQAGSLRARAGWIFGSFMPYAFAGLVVGLADININATITGEQNPGANGTCSGAATPPCVPFAFSATGGQNSTLLYGAVAGGGLEWMLMPNFFVRAEYAYTRFAPVDGVLISNLAAHIGAGVKF
jgi:opacity protein-like surface antigen